jgi:hypothetical protein
VLVYEETIFLKERKKIETDVFGTNFRDKPVAIMITFPKKISEN